MSRKKIIYGITKGGWGGAQRYVYDLATVLPTDDFEVTVLTGSDGRLLEKLREKKIRCLVLEGLTRDIHFFTDILILFKLIRFFHREKPDIIHLNSSKIGLLGAMAGRLTGVPRIIFTGHGWAFNEDRSLWQRKIIYCLHLLTIALAHHTIAVSEQTKKQISAGNHYYHKISVIHNGLPVLDFLEPEQARATLQEKLPAGGHWSGRPWIGTISELHKNKGLKYIIEAMHRLEVTAHHPERLPILIIIGEGERREKLQERIDRYGLQDIVFMIGRMDEAQKYLKAFDIFTLTSITEALPYVILEAGQAGRPVLASNVGGIPEIIDDMKDGILIRPGEPEEIQGSLEFLLSNPDKAHLLGENLQKKIFTHFSQDTMVKETIKLYN
jgi:glycosyltransferase involved in cell wall biosynthesis